MKKKLWTMAAVLAASLTVSQLTADAAILQRGMEAQENREDADGQDAEASGELTKYDIRTTPAKKTLAAGKTFYIRIVAAADSEWEDLSKEEWNEICEENIDSITFRSTKSSVASVNKKTGKVTGRKKGSTVIRTSISFANGETAVYKTKVYVTKALSEGGSYKPDAEIPAPEEEENTQHEAGSYKPDPIIPAPEWEAFVMDVPENIC